MKKKTELTHILMLLLTALIWGFAFTAQSVGAEYVGAFTFLASRSWIAFVCLIPVIRIRAKRTSAAADANGREAGTLSEEKDKTEIGINSLQGSGQETGPDASRMMWLGGAVCGFFLFTASMAQQVGIAYTTTAKAGFITALYVVIVPILSVLLGKKLKMRLWISIVISVIGLYLLCIRGEFRLGQGDLLMMLCSLLFSFQIMSVNYFTERTDSVRLAWIQFLVVASLATVGMLIFEHPTLEGLAGAALPILYAGALSSAVGYTLQIVGQRGLNPAIASLVMSLESVFSALGGWLLLHQVLSVREIIGCILMFAAIVIAQL